MFFEYIIKKFQKSKFKFIIKGKIGGKYAW